MIAATVKRLAPRLTRHRVFFFGSRVSGASRPRSDFDVGIDGPGPLPLADFFALEAALEDLPTLHRIELVDFSRVSSEFRRQALAQTETIPL
jgi:predicted nucleotidyltransferase